MDHAVEIVADADEEAELGDVPDLAFDLAADGVGGHEGLPGIVLGLLDAEADAALDRVDVEDLDVDLLAGGDDLARMGALARPAHLRDVDQALDARLQLHEGAVIGDVGDPPLEAGGDRIFGGHALPGVGLQLLHAQADALRLRVEAHHLHAHRLPDVQRLAGVVDAPPGDVGDVQQAVEAPQVHEGAVIGDVLDDAVQHLAFGEAGDQRRPLVGALVFEHRAARDHDVAAPAVHLEDAEFVLVAHQRRDVAHGADVDLAAGQEGEGAAQIDREAALDPLDDVALHPVAGAERRFQLVPDLFALRLLARKHGLAVAVLQALDEDLHLVAHGEPRRAARRGELPQRHAALRLQAHVDHGAVALQGHHPALDDGAFDDGDPLQEFVEQLFEALFGCRCLLHRAGVGHGVSRWLRGSGGCLGFRPRRGGSRQRSTRPRVSSPTACIGPWRGAFNRSSTIARARAKARSASRPVVSSSTASAARLSGASARWLSRRSRSASSAATAAHAAASPRARSSAQRRRTRSSKLAVTNSLACAPGQTTVPMSRPSIAAPGGRAAKRRVAAV